MSKNQGEGIKHRLKTLLGLRKTNPVPTIGNEYEEEQEFIITVDKLKVCKSCLPLAYLCMGLGFCMISCFYS